jgi:hypothetical protein
MSGTDYLEGRFLDHITGNGAYTPPTSLYLCLHTADPTETGAIGHITGGSYAPQLITFGPQVTSRASSTNSQTFLNMPATTATHFSIRENSPTGNPMFVGILTNPRTTVAGEPMVFGVGVIVLLAD